MKKSITALGFTLLALTLVAPAAFARGGGGGHGQGDGPTHQRRGAHFAEKLGLTAQQQQAFKALRQDRKAEGKANRGVAKAQRAELSALWEAEEPDANAIVAVLTEMSKLKLQRRIGHMEFKLAAKRILTAEQFETFKAMKKGRHGKFGRRGKRGHGGRRAHFEGSEGSRPGSCGGGPFEGSDAADSEL